MKQVPAVHVRGLRGIYEVRALSDLLGLLILERKDEALASFRAGAEAGPAGMPEYLNRDAIRTIDSPR